jgi:hypothetical protein
MKVSRFLLVLLLSIVLSAVFSGSSAAQQTTPGEEVPPVPASPMAPEQLQQLVAPIALYPDSLVAQILAASTYPTQIVEAGRWLQQNQNLQGQALADAVNQQSWDPSVKALTAFPSVLANMDQNLSWTQSLGDAYYNQPQDVMDAIQVMRQKAEQAGNLKSTPQQTVTTSGPDITIQPANPSYVYVPVYDPWLVYGPPLPIWPGFAFGGVWVNRPFFSFGVAINLGFWGGFGWGWPAWGFDWRAHHLFYNRAPYVPRGPAFYNNRAYRPPVYRPAPGSRGPQPYRGAQTAYRGPAPGVRPPVPAPHAVEPPVGRGFGSPRGQTGTNTGAFNGYAHGGVTQNYAARGMGSLGARPAPAPRGNPGGGASGGARGGAGGRR